MKIQRNIVCVLCSFALACAFMPANGSLAPQNAAADVFDVSGEPEYVSGELVVTLDKSAPAAQRQAALELLECEAESVEEIEGADALIGTTLVAQLDDDDADATVRQLEQMPGVASATRNYTLKLQDVSTDDTYLSYQYYLNEWDLSASTTGMNVSKAWDLSRSEQSVTVAILDSGIDYTHADLKGNIDLDHMARTDSGKAVVGNAPDTSGHGTMVAGIISAQANNAAGTAGVSYNAKLLPIRIVSSSNDITIKSAVSAFSYLKELVDSGEVADLAVINASWGGYSEDDTYFAAIEDCISEMRSAGVMTICSGGNGDGSQALTDVNYPSDYDCAFSVTSLDAQGNNSTFSDYNQFKDISASGEQMYSTLPEGKTISGTKVLSDGYGYSISGGTSFAAPVVTGAVALMKAAVPGLTPNRVEECLKRTASAINTSENYHATTGSAGALNASAAAAYALVKYGSNVDSELKAQAQAELDGYGIDTSTGLVAITKASVSAMKSSYVYTGKSLKPAPVLKYNGVKLKKNADYVLVYSDNKLPGTAKVTVYGKGSYKGKRTIKFKIAPKATKVKKLIAKSGALKVKWGKRASYNITGYEIRYSLKKSMKSSKKKLVSSKTSASAQITGLKSKKRYYVQVRTYKRLAGEKYCSAWSAKKSVKTK